MMGHMDTPSPWLDDDQQVLWQALLTVGAAADAGSAVSAIDRMVMGNSTRSVWMN